MGRNEASLGLYVGNLHVLWGVLEPLSGCMLATYRSDGVWWSQFGAACWQPTGLTGQFGVVYWQPTGVMGCVGANLGLYVGNLHVFWGVLKPVWGCMLATYMSYGVCWRQFAAVCSQPKSLMGCVGASFGLYVGNLQVLCGVLEPVWGCMLATYKCCGVCWSQFAAVCWQPTSLMGRVGASLRLYVGNL